MDFNKAREVARQYVKEMRSSGWEAERADPDKPYPEKDKEERMLRHVLWLCEQIAENKVLSEPKAMRWLGFVQGVFWALGLMTISEMKRHNKPTDLKGVKE
jgi:hypothetical protein